MDPHSLEDRNEPIGEGRCDWAGSRDVLTLTNRSGNRVALNPLGAAMSGIFVPDRAGRSASVSVDAGGSAGKTIGRYANRIARGSFVLLERRFQPIDLAVSAATRGFGLHTG
jgi:galactose mutarotase-like enzyme